MNLSHYSKALVAIAAAIGVTGAALSDGAVDSAEVTAIVAAWVGVLGVFGITNQPKSTDAPVPNPPEA